MSKNQAQETSFAKWSILRKDFDAQFQKISSPCGYCTYSLERDASIARKCGVCKREFPEIFEICKRMLDFFSCRHEEVDNMIVEIIDVIRKQKTTDIHASK